MKLRDLVNFALNHIITIVLFLLPDTSLPEIYTLSLHDALPISINAIVQGWKRLVARVLDWHVREQVEFNRKTMACIDRKSTRLNSSHSSISYAVFCLKNKTIKINSHHYIIMTIQLTMLNPIISA